MSHPSRNRTVAAARPRAACSAARRMAWRIHGDQSGSISIVSLFAILLLVMLLGMIMNSARQVDQKVKMQNAADAATHSGGVVLARSMNELAFTNHLICDVFALTAFLNEAVSQRARGFSDDPLADDILDHWERAAPVFQDSEFPKFAELGAAIAELVPWEREMIGAYSEWSYASALQLLPTLQMILDEEPIPLFQRDLVSVTPNLVQLATDEIARRHGNAWPERTRLQGTLWRTLPMDTGADVVGGWTEDALATLPAIDPLAQPSYLEAARTQRRQVASAHLARWNETMLRAFDYFGKTSQFSQLWRAFTCGELERLLDAHSLTNLPHMIRTTRAEIDEFDTNAYLERECMFVGVVYRQRQPDRMPRLFRNPIPADTTAYAQTMLFVPRRRLVWHTPNPVTPLIGGVPGDPVDDPRFDPTLDDTGDPADSQRQTIVVRQWRGSHPEAWDLWCQNWTVQLAPATAPIIPTILSTPPPFGDVGELSLPELSGLPVDDFRWLSNH